MLKSNHLRECRSAPFLFPRHSQTKSWNKLKPTYVGPHVFGKVLLVTFVPANWEKTGDIQFWLYLCYYLISIEHFMRCLTAH